MWLKIREIHEIKDPQIFSADNYSRIATIQRLKTLQRWQLFKNARWKLFRDGNYWRIENYSKVTNIQGGISTWSPAVSGLVSLSTFLFTSPLALLQLSLEVFNVAGVLLPQNLDLLPFILQSHWQLLHYVGTLRTYTVYIYTCTYICDCPVLLPKVIPLCLLCS